MTNPPKPTDGDALGERIKVYRIGCDFYAAKNLRDAVREYCSCSGDTIREALEDMELLSEKEMNAFWFYDDLYERNEISKRTFTEQLKLMVEANDKFPTAFASSEY